MSRYRTTEEELEDERACRLLLLDKSIALTLARDHARAALEGALAGAAWLRAERDEAVREAIRATFKAGIKAVASEIVREDWRRMREGWRRMIPGEDRCFSGESGEAIHRHDPPAAPTGEAPTCAATFAEYRCTKAASHTSSPVWSERTYHDDTRRGAKCVCGRPMAYDPPPAARCTTCGGEGHVSHDVMGVDPVSIECPACRGTGKGE